MNSSISAVTMWKHGAFRKTPRRLTGLTGYAQQHEDCWVCSESAVSLHSLRSNHPVKGFLGSEFLDPFQFRFLLKYGIWWHWVWNWFLDRSWLIKKLRHLRAVLKLTLESWDETPRSHSQTRFLERGSPSILDNDIITSVLIFYNFPELIWASCGFDDCPDAAGVRACDDGVVWICLGYPPQSPRLKEENI